MPRLVPVDGEVDIFALQEKVISFATDGQPGDLLAAVQNIGHEQAQPTGTESAGKSPVGREDLRLVCFDYIWL